MVKRSPLPPPRYEIDEPSFSPDGTLIAASTDTLGFGMSKAITAIFIDPLS
jgi:hypothetical protein